MTTKERIKNVSIDDFVRKAITLYGNEVLMNRSIPDFRDGLKPVQRRIVYWMKERSGNNRIKAARAVDYFG